MSHQGPELVRRRALYNNSVGVLLLLLSLFLPTASSASQLTSLADEPEWRTLNEYQERITFEEFARLLTRMCPSGAMQPYLDLTPSEVTVYSTPEKLNKLWTLHFATGEAKPRPRVSKEFIRRFKFDPEKGPLQGLTFCMDPGHIGGEWAYIEERKFRLKKDEPWVMEGELTTITCELIAKDLERLGANVVWTRQMGVPVTPYRPQDPIIEQAAIQRLWKRNPKEAERLFNSQKRARFQTRSKSRNLLVQKAWWTAELLFYRTSEIQHRAYKTAEFKADLNIALHYNAAPWKRGRIRLLDANKLVVYTSGSFMEEEVKYDDIKFHLFRKILEGSSDTEVAVSEKIAYWMEQDWGWGPLNYNGKDYAHSVSGNPYVWSRNLMANRSFHGPTIFVEGPYMNDKSIYPRLIAGDYEGVKEINGKLQRSIFREFSDIVVKGILDHYGLTAPDIEQSK